MMAASHQATGRTGPRPGYPASVVQTSSGRWTESPSSIGHSIGCSTPSISRRAGSRPHPNSQGTRHGAQAAVEEALRVGNRHVDTAAPTSTNAKSVKASAAPAWPAMRCSSRRRKGWISDYGYDATLHAFDKSAGKLDVKQLDLLILHQALPSAIDRTLDAYQALEKLLADGTVRAIGVSNFMPEHLDHLLAETSVARGEPDRAAPVLPQPALQRVHADHGNVSQAWSPIGGITSYRAAEKSTFDDPTLLEIARQYGKSAAQVMLRWHLQEGRSVIRSRPGPPASPRTSTSSTSSSPPSSSPRSTRSTPECAAGRNRTPSPSKRSAGTSPRREPARPAAELIRRRCGCSARHPARRLRRARRVECRTPVRYHHLAATRHAGAGRRARSERLLAYFSRAGGTTTTAAGRTWRSATPRSWPR